MRTPRSTKEAHFTDVDVDIDHYSGPNYDPILVGNPSTWEKIKLRLDDWLLKKKGHK